MARKQYTKFELTNLSLGGLTPKYWQSEYNTYGNSNHASDMKNMDLTNPTSLHPGPGRTALTGGTVDTLITGILEYPVSDNTTYAVGGEKVYEIGQSTVTDDTDYPHTITGTEVEAEDVVNMNGYTYYSYNTSTSGNIGRVSGGTFSDEWASSSGLTLQSGVPHQMEVAGSDGSLGVIDDYNFHTWDGSNIVANDFSTEDPDSVFVSVVWNRNRWVLAANRPYVTSGNNRLRGSVYVWDGASSSWETRAEVNGEIGALFAKDGVTWVFYQENISDNVSTLGVLNQNKVEPITTWQGDLPSYYQVTEENSMLCWLSGDKVYCYGASNPALEVRLFQYVSSEYSTGGGLASPFANSFVASTDSTNYDISQLENYETDAYWKSLLLNLRGGQRMGHIKQIRTNYEPLSSGAQADLKLVDSQGTTLWDGTISYTSDSGTIRKDFNVGINNEDARLEVDYSNSSNSNTVKLKSIKLYGHTKE